MGTTWAINPRARTGPVTAASHSEHWRPQVWPLRAMAPMKGPVIVASVVRDTGRSPTSPVEPEMTARYVRVVNGRSRPRKMTVLCGHTHGSGEAQVLPNLRVLTGGAVYGKPGVQRVLEVE
jgi:hypothetical protein